MGWVCSLKCVLLVVDRFLLWARLRHRQLPSGVLPGANSLHRGFRPRLRAVPQGATVANTAPCLEVGTVSEARTALQLRNFFAMVSNCSLLKGFTIHPLAPAAFPAIFFSSCDSVVSMMIGMYLY